MQVIMRLLSLLLLLPLGLLAQKPNKQDIAWACGTKEHRCSCPMMVGEVQSAWIKHCETGGPVGYDECMKNIPKDCDIIQKPDKIHPEHTCRRNCTTAVCRCNDEATICVGPTLP